MGRRRGLTGLDFELAEQGPQRAGPAMPMQNAWSQSGNLVTFDPTQGVTMQQQFPLPGNYTVQFGLGPLPGQFGTPAAIRRPRALVSWSIQGDTVFRELTVQDGTSITGQAEAVAVRLFDDLVAPMFGVAGNPYVGTIIASRGGRAAPGQQAPIFYPREFVLFSTFPAVNQSSGAIVVGANDTAFIQVPQGATQLMVNCMSNQVPPVPLTQADVRVDIQDSSAAPFGLRLASYFPQPSIWVMLPSQATSVALRHFATPATDVEYSVVFGIDG